MKTNNNVIKKDAGGEGKKGAQIKNALQGF